MGCFVIGSIFDPRRETQNRRRFWLQIFSASYLSPGSPAVGTTGNGTCGATSFGGDCDEDASGAWDAQKEGIATLEQCVAKAKPCAMANFVSFSYVDGNHDVSQNEQQHTRPPFSVLRPPPPPHPHPTPIPIPPFPHPPPPPPPLL